MAGVQSDTAKSGLIEALAPKQPDALLAVLKACQADPRPDKLDLGVGVYRDETGNTPVMRAVKATERLLLERQTTKAYLGAEGDLEFFRRLIPLAFGSADVTDRLAGVQTPGGGGALRLAAELIATARPGAAVLLGLPAWPNHPQILKQTGLEARTYVHVEPGAQAARFDALRQALRQAGRGDVLMIQASCHNPTGIDLDEAEWREAADLMAERGVMPFIDLAYQGLGEGLDGDAKAVRIVAERVGEMLLAYSCDKNFGLYRERTGALFVLTGNAAVAATVQSNLTMLARPNWSMPPDHGAAVVRLILESPELTADWRAELDAMRRRIDTVRQRLAAADPTLAPLARQRGMFATLPLAPEQIATLRDRHGIYMTGTGRINVAGLTEAAVPGFVAALDTVRR